MKRALKNSIDHLKEHCLEIRGDIDLATETKIQEIQVHRDELLQKVDEYEKEKIIMIQNDLGNIIYLGHLVIIGKMIMKHSCLLWPIHRKCHLN